MGKGCGCGGWGKGGEVDGDVNCGKLALQVGDELREVVGGEWRTIVESESVCPLRPL